MLDIKFENFVLIIWGLIIDLILIMPPVLFIVFLSASFIRFLLKGNFNINLLKNKIDSNNSEDNAGERQINNSYVNESLIKLLDRLIYITPFILKFLRKIINRKFFKIFSGVILYSVLVLVAFLCSSIPIYISSVVVDSGKIIFLWSKQEHFLTIEAIINLVSQIMIIGLLLCMNIRHTKLLSKTRRYLASVFLCFFIITSIFISYMSLNNLELNLQQYQLKTNITSNHINNKDCIQIDSYNTNNNELCNIKELNNKDKKMGQTNITNIIIENTKEILLKSKSKMITVLLLIIPNIALIVTFFIFFKLGNICIFRVK